MLSFIPFHCCNLKTLVTVPNLLKTETPAFWFSFYILPIFPSVIIPRRSSIFPTLGVSYNFLLFNLRWPLSPMATELNPLSLSAANCPQRVIISIVESLESNNEKKKSFSSIEQKRFLSLKEGQSNCQTKGQ